MIVTRNIALRLAALIVLTVVLQVAFFSHLSLLGAQPNAVPAVVASLGLLGGGVVGAVCGFAVGFLVDSVLLQTLGVSSLVLLAVGYLAGRYRERFGIRRRYSPALLAGGFTLFATAGFAVLQLMLGVDAAVSLLVVREIVVQSLLAIGLGFCLFPLVRRLVAPALIDYSPASRRALIPRLRLRRRSPRRARPITADGEAPRRPSTRVRASHRGRRERGTRVGGGIA